MKTFLSNLLDFALVVIVLFLVLFGLNARAASVTLVNGYLYTNFTYSVGAGNNTNSSGVLTNNVQLGVVTAATTNYYSLAISGAQQGNIGGIQSATNLWPSQALDVTGGYPGTIWGPFRTFQCDLAVSTTVTNSAGNATFVRRYAGYDGVLWVSNAFSVTVTIPTTTTSGISSSNFQSSFYAIAAQQDEWSTSTSAITNEVNVINSGAGL